MLFARDNNVKLYRVFNSLAIQYPQMKFAVVAQTGAKALETKYCNRPRIRRIIQNLTPVFRYRTTIANKAMIIVKDRSSKPLKMSSRLIYEKMLRVLFPPFRYTIRSSLQSASTFAARMLIVRTNSQQRPRCWSPTSFPSLSQPRSPTLRTCATPLEASRASFWSSPASLKP